MSFFQSTKDMILKLAVYQVAMAIFGFVTVTASAAEKTGTLSILASILGICLYHSICYSLMWGIGGKDKIKVDAGRLEKNYLKPVYMSLLVNIPNFLFGLIWITQFIPGTFFISLSAIGRVLSLGLQSYYLGVCESISLHTNPFVWLALPLISVGICSLGYIAGYKGIRIFPESKKEKDRLTK